MKTRFDGHTPGPWGVNKDFPTAVVPLSHINRPIGGSVDPDVEAARYAKIIANETGTEFPEFNRSRITPGEDSANAQLIAAAPDLLALAQELRESGREMRTWIMNNTDAINSPTFILDRADIALAHASAILDAQEEKDA